MQQRSKNDLQLSSQNETQVGKKMKSRKRLVYNKKIHDGGRFDSNSSLSIGVSTFRVNSITQHELYGFRQDENQCFGMGYFTEKYLPRNAPVDELEQEMRMVLTRKQNQLASLRIYRDELKLISLTRAKNQSFRLSVQSLKKKAEIQQKMSEMQISLQRQLKNMDKQIQSMNEYSIFMNKFLETKNGKNSQMLDIGHEEEVLVKNLELETTHLMKELADEQRRNTHDIRQVQDEIQDLRVSIQLKQNILRDLKARICTMYIKLHSRASSRTGSKSKDRNMSLSVKKFNSQNHLSIRQVYIGNNAFKNYSKELIEKVNSNQELIKIKFFVSDTDTTNNKLNSKKRQQLSFQCIYKGREGIIHKFTDTNQVTDSDMTRDKISESGNHCEEILVKYIFSMKFFYKSRIVGVQCRVKTEKGNKHIQIGICNPSIEHQLLTLVNKRIVTLGSFWHGKEMIGVSVWYSDQHRRDNNLIRSSSNRSIKAFHNKEVEDKTCLQTYEEYYS